jgi:hypothetical protein
MDVPTMAHRSGMNKRHMVKYIIEDVELIE